MITTKQIDMGVDDIHAVITFANNCYQLGYKNNTSLLSMKYEWCIDIGGAWFATYDENRIISLSGVHPFEDGYRALFRGAQLQTRPCGLNRYHMQSYCFADQLPLQIEFAGDNPIYITTNINNDASGKMNAVDKIFHRLVDYKIVDFVARKVVYYTDQNIWKLNVERYKSKRYSN